MQLLLVEGSFSYPGVHAHRKSEHSCEGGRQSLLQVRSGLQASRMIDLYVVIVVVGVCVCVCIYSTYVYQLFCMQLTC